MTSLATLPRVPLDVPLGLIDAPALPARLAMDETKLDELTANVRVNGILQRLILARVGERFEVIAGHRRFMAAGRAGLVCVPADVYADKTEALEAAKYAENRFREEMSAAEEASYFSELLERDCGGDIDRLCAQLGEKRSYVEGRVLLYQGDPLVLQRLAERAIAIGIAQELNKVSDQTYRRYLLHQAIVGGATQAVVRGWIMAWQQEQRQASGAPAPASAAAPMGPVPETHFFRCAICLEENDPHTMLPINVHSSCKHAILDKLLKAYRGDA